MALGDDLSSHKVIKKISVAARVTTALVRVLHIWTLHNSAGCNYSHDCPGWYVTV